jgi:hypothetical protein
MRGALLQSILVGVAVALASRFSEWAFRQFAPQAETAGNLVGMSIAGLTAGVLFYLWRYQTRARIRLLRDRERVVQHVHHHVRNSLQVIVNRHHNDQLVTKHVEHILKEMTYALPGRGKLMPDQPDDVSSTVDSEEVQKPKG